MLKNDYENKIIWIIGASSGIGESLAIELASRGATLCLSARRIPELEKLKSALPGKNHQSFPLDVCDADSVAKTTQIIFSHYGRVDSIIFLAAAYNPMRLDKLDLIQVKLIIETNLLSAFYVVHSVLPLLKQQSSGQIALCGSIAGFIGLPAGQPYSATKAGIINLAESLRSELPSHFDVKIINPGFVKTELTDKNKFEMPMIITPQRAAKYIADGLIKPNFEIHFPKKFTFILKFIKILPYAISTKLLARLNVRNKS